MEKGMRRDIAISLGLAAYKSGAVGGLARCDPFRKVVLQKTNSTVMCSSWKECTCVFSAFVSRSILVEREAHLRGWKQIDSWCHSLKSSIKPRGRSLALGFLAVQTSGFLNEVGCSVSPGVISLIGSILQKERKKSSFLKHKVKNAYIVSSETQPTLGHEKSGYFLF